MSRDSGRRDGCCHERCGNGPQHARGAEARCKSSQRTRDHQLGGRGFVSARMYRSLGIDVALDKEAGERRTPIKITRAASWCRGSVRHVGWLSLLIVSRMPAPMQW